MTKLSVNINKIATLRNSRGGNNPDVVKAAMDCERFGAQGITVHPRPDERHIRYDDVRQIKQHIQVELNIEGNPLEASFLELVLSVKPAQVTFVPDTLGQLTSDHGWDVREHFEFLSKTILSMHQAGIRTSLFVDPSAEMIRLASTTGTKRVELYTEAYAKGFQDNKDKAISEYVLAAQAGLDLGLEINAGHDLSLDNLRFFKEKIPTVSEVSIGHALISDALYLGLENTIALYLRCLQ